jgi:hypothetical protein
MICPFKIYSTRRRFLVLQSVSSFSIDHLNHAVNTIATVPQGDDANFDKPSHAMSTIGFTPDSSDAKLQLQSKYALVNLIADIPQLTLIFLS